MEIGNFKISGHSTKRKWAVYLFIATPIDGMGLRKIYVGKTGDNRDGCNPVVSRVGNHFSFNKNHSQIRNKIGQTEDYDYEYFYCQFYDYKTIKNDWKNSCDKTNELERELKRCIKRIMDNENFELLNPFIGKHIPKQKQIELSKLITVQEKAKLELLCKMALK